MSIRASVVLVDLGKTAAEAHERIIGNDQVNAEFIVANSRAMYRIDALSLNLSLLE